MSTYLGSQQISQVTRVTFSGNSNPVESVFPRSLGVLLKPSNKAERIIELQCMWSIKDQTKTEVEKLQHDLVEEMVARREQNLSVNGNIYERVIVANISQKILEQNEYFVYTVQFRLHYAQDFMNSLVSSTQVREGYFTYNYGDKDQEQSEFRIRFYNNWEAGFNGSFGNQEEIRKLMANGKTYNLSGGKESIELNCWLVQTPTQHIESYFFNLICGPGPLGKLGALYLDGETYTKVIMTNFSQELIRGNKGSDNAGASTTYYSLTFVTSVKC